MMSPLFFCPGVSSGSGEFAQLLQTPVSLRVCPVGYVRSAREREQSAGGQTLLRSQC